MGVFEFGMVFFTYTSMESGARDVVRQIAVNAMTVESGVQQIRQRLPPWTSSSASILITQSAPADAATNVYTATVNLPLSAASPMTFWTVLSDRDLQVRLVMKQELPVLDE